MKRSSLQRKTTLKRGAPTSPASAGRAATPKPSPPPRPGSRDASGRRRVGENASDEAAWRRRVTDLYGNRCIVTGQPTHAAPHHVIPKRTLRNAGRGDLVWNPVNGVPVTLNVHANHEAASERIPRRCLPTATIAWAHRHGFGWYIDDPRIYP